MIVFARSFHKSVGSKNKESIEGEWCKLETVKWTMVTLTVTHNAKQNFAFVFKNFGWSMTSSSEPSFVSQLDEFTHEFSFIFRKLKNVKQSSQDGWQKKEVLTHSQTKKYADKSTNPKPFFFSFCKIFLNWILIFLDFEQRYFILYPSDNLYYFRDNTLKEQKGVAILSNIVSLGRKDNTWVSEKLDRVDPNQL